MSLFSGHPDKHRGVVIESPEMEEEDPVEFGPKLTSKFFAFFFFLRFKDVASISLSVIGSLVLKRARVAGLISKPVGDLVNHIYPGRRDDCNAPKCKNDDLFGTDPSPKNHRLINGPPRTCARRVNGGTALRTRFA